MARQLNSISKKEMRLILELFVQYNVYLKPDDIKFLKILRRDDINYEYDKTYAIDQIKRLITKVNVISCLYPDERESIKCNWEQLFDNELSKLSKYAAVLSDKRPNEVNVFETTSYMLNSFIDYIYDEVLSV